MRHVLLLLPAAAAALALAAPGPAPAGGALVVKASPVARPCVLAAVPSFEAAGGPRVRLLPAASIGAVDSADGADVVVAVEQELTRVLEGGAALDDVDADLGTIPWVLAASASGAEVPDLRTLDRATATVRVPSGVISRHARASLQSLPPDRVRTTRAEPLGPLAPGELALVPLSLAGKARVRATDVPPLLVRALGVRGTARPEAARAFVDFLAHGRGNAAFRACGREDGR